MTALLNRLTLHIFTEDPMQNTATALQTHEEFAAEAQKRVQTYEPEAWVIEELMASSTLNSCSKFGKHVTELGFKCYRDRFLAAAGNPTDPVEVMLLEQLMLANHQINTLYAQAAESSAIEDKEVYNSAAARLLGEFRRMALALKEYRTSTAPKQLTVVEQQNVAAGNQQIAYVNGKAAPLPSPEKASNTHIRSKPQEALSHEQQITSLPESKKSRSREAEPVIARSDDARGA
jgi:hypothetical protein